MRPFDAQPTSPSETPVAPRRPGLSLCPCRGFKCGSAAGSRAALERDLDCAHSTLLRIRHPRPTPPAVRRARPRVLRGARLPGRTSRVLLDGATAFVAERYLELTWAATYIINIKDQPGPWIADPQPSDLPTYPATCAGSAGPRAQAVAPVGAGHLSACGLRATEAGPATRTLRNSRTIDMMAECTTQVTASMRERTSITARVRLSQRPHLRRWLVIVVG